MVYIEEWLLGYDPRVQAVFATLFTWGVTAIGAAVVFVFKDFNQKLLDAMMGFAAGVMIAASIWSLLLPSLEMSHDINYLPNWAPALIGFMTGGLFLAMIDKIIPHLHPGLKNEEAEGLTSGLSRSILLVLAITLHNIPEGLAIGVAFGSASLDGSSATLSAAIILAIGIGLQNLPEGTAVSVPLRREGMSRLKSFYYGQASGIVEPFAAFLGAAMVMSVSALLPYALAFAAGAMIFVVVEELIPASHQDGNSDLATMFTLIGFSVMMTMDVALG